MQPMAHITQTHITGIANYRLNWPRSQFSKNTLKSLCCGCLCCGFLCCGLIHLCRCHHRHHHHHHHHHHHNAISFHSALFPIQGMAQIEREIRTTKKELQSYLQKVSHTPNKKAQHWLLHHCYPLLGIPLIATHC